MSHFTDSLKTCGVTPVDIIALGDSVTEGMICARREDAWPQKLRDGVRSARFSGSVRGGLGYAPSYSVSGSVGDFWQRSGAVTVDTTLLTGLGCRMLKVPFGASVSLGFTGTGLDVLYTSCADSSFAYSVDGGADIAIDKRGGPLVAGNVFQARGLCDGAHTITVKGTALGNAYVEGAMVYRGDENSGVRMWESGHSGWQASDFNANPNWRGSFQAVPNPKLVLIALGRNEYQKNISVATFSSELTTLVSTVRGLLSGKVCSGVIMAEHKRVPISGYPDWADFENEMAKVAAANSFGYLSQSAGIGDPATAIANGWIESTTGCHPLSAGHNVYATALLANLGVTP
jgi:hypothetical protein